MTLVVCPFHIQYKWMKSSELTNNIMIQGSMSQILDLCPSFNFMAKNGKI